MKKLFVMILLFLGALSANAQAVKVSFGIKGFGLGILPQTEVAPTTMAQLGGGGGAFLGTRIVNFIGLQAEALYGYQVASYTIENFGEQTWQSTQQYLYVPLIFQAWLGRGFAFEFGYQQAIALSGTLNTGSEIKNDTGILDYGSVVAGMNINMGKVAFLNFRYLYALDNSYVMTTTPSRNMGVQVGLGFRFFTSKKSVFKKR